MASENDFNPNNVPIEVAINKAGFGLYSYLLTTLAGLAIISFAFIAYGSTILIPASACELETTSGQQGALAAAPVVGAILGSLIWGYLADTRGRWNMMMVSLLASAVINMVASISVNWIMLMFIQFVASLMAAGLYSMSMSLLSESVPMAKRNLVLLLVSSIFLLSQGIMAVLAIPIIPLSFSIELPLLNIYWNSWRTLVLVYSMPCLVTAGCLFFMQKSPKYTFTKGDEGRTLEILRAIHRINHLGSKEEYPVLSLLPEPRDLNAGPSSAKDQIVPLFKAPLLKYTCIMTCLYVFQQVGAFVVWLPTVANQFIMILETGEGSDLTLCGVIDASINTPADPDTVPCALNVNAMLIVLVVGALQSLVNFLLSLIVNKVGRRNIVIAMTALCGVSGIVVNLVPNAIGSGVFYIILLMGIVVVGIYTAIVVALFPTHLRAMAIALPMMGGRIGTFASVQILNLMLVNTCDAGFYLFSVIFASSAIVASFLPDDRRLAVAKPPPPTTDKKEPQLTKL